MVQNWLGRSEESLGGNYGENPPSDLQFIFTPEGQTGQCAMIQDPESSGYENTLSAFSLAEMTRRLTLFRDILEENRVIRV